jgi:flavodoxin
MSDKIQSSSRGETHEIAEMIRTNTQAESVYDLERQHGDSDEEGYSAGEEKK